MSISAVRAAFSGRGRVVALRYLAVATIANLGWEVLQLPLYTMWWTGTPGEIAYAIIHCTAGDIVLVGATLFVALLLAGDDGRPWGDYVRVAVIDTALGIACTVFSEGLNVEVRRSWAIRQQCRHCHFSEPDSRRSCNGPLFHQRCLRS